MLCIIQNKNILIVLYELFLRKIIIKCEAQSTVTGLQLKNVHGLSDVTAVLQVRIRIQRIRIILADPDP